MALESIEKLRELACDINGNEIVDHMQFYSWHCEFDRELEALEREIAERYMELPADADGVPWTKSDRVFIVKNEQSPRNITAFSFELAEKRWLIEDDNCCSFYADECTHVKPDPVKELLDDVCLGTIRYPRERITGYLEDNHSIGEAVLLDVRDRLTAIYDEQQRVVEK